MTDLLWLGRRSDRAVDVGASTGVVPLVGVRMSMPDLSRTLRQK